MRNPPTIWALIAVWLLCRNAAAGEEPETWTQVPRVTELRDQFGAPQNLSFPSKHITFLTIADRKGSEQIAAWVTPVKERFGPRIDIRGVADVSRVPRLLRGMIRKKFQEAQAYPVMMDWSGRVCNQLGGSKNVATILVLGRDGAILARFSGVANGPNIAELIAALDTALSIPPKITTGRSSKNP